MGNGADTAVPHSGESRGVVHTMKFLAHSLTAAARWILLRALVVALPLSVGAVGFPGAAKSPPTSTAALRPLASSAGNEDIDDEEDDSAAEPGAPPSAEPGGYFPGPPGEAGPSGTNPTV